MFAVLSLLLRCWISATATLTSGAGFFDLWLNGLRRLSIGVYIFTVVIFGGTQGHLKANLKRPSGFKLLPPTHICPDQEYQALAGVCPRIHPTPLLSFQPVNKYNSSRKMKKNAHNLFPSATTDVKCQHSPCLSSHLLRRFPKRKTGDRRERRGTVYLHSLYEFNSALQNAQSLEMYRSALCTKHTVHRG